MHPSHRCHVSLTHQVFLAALVTVVCPTLSWAGQAGAPPGTLSLSAPRPAQPTGPTLELSMDRAVELALEANLGLQSDRMTLDSASHGVAAARAAFLPQVSSSLSRLSSRSVPSDFTQGSADITSHGINVGTGLSQALPALGTRYTVAWTNSRNSQAGGNPLFNPFLSSSFSVNLTQPLWRGLTIDQNRASLTTSQRQRAIADVQLQQQIVRLEGAVRNAYLDLVSAIQELRVADENMEIRQASLANARARVEVGASAPIELISAEADVASNQEQVLVAQARIATREDALRTLMLDPTRADYWQVHLVPTDTLAPASPRIDLDAAVKNALAARLDLLVARRQLDIEDLELEVGQDARHPAVDVQLSYATFGNGGTRLSYGEGFPPPVVGRTARGFGSVLNDTFGAAYPRWSLGVNVSYPIGRSAAESTGFPLPTEGQGGALPAPPAARPRRRPP